MVFATTEDINGTALRVAVSTEARRRGMEPFDRFIVPAAWGIGYAKLCKSVPYCVDAAAELVARLIDPALAGEADGKMWSHRSLAWT